MQTTITVVNLIHDPKTDTDTPVCWVFPACSWREIKEKWYYFDGNGYMVTNCYVKALGENLYYWISEDGVWDENETTATPNRARYLVY